VSETPSAWVEEERRVVPLELFFDLVFVFAVTQVTGLMAHEETALGLLRGMLVLGAVWWAWSAYAWLTNTVDPARVTPRLVLCAAMAAMMLVALATPGAFEDDGVLFALAYAVVRFLHILLYALGSPHVSVRAAILRLAPSSAVACGLILAAGFLGSPVREVLWAVALLIDYGGPAVMGVANLTVSPGHFAERFGLVMIIALGESVVAIGIGAEGLALTGAVVTAALLGIVVAVAVWWVYFDVMAAVAERRLRTATGATRAHLARDAYSYLHLPMAAGIVLLALGVENTLAHVGDPLEPVGAVALGGGAALYLAAHTGLRLRVGGGLSAPRPLAALACLALIPLAAQVMSLTALALLAGIWILLITYEAFQPSEKQALTG